MPVTPTYPGVYVEEISSGVRTITGVATSIAAFVDYFKRGPMNRAVQLFNWGDFVREFGGLDAKSEASYALQQFFLNGGSEAWAVRVAAGTPAKATALIAATAGGASAALTVTAISEGEWGRNLRASVDAFGTKTGEFNLTISEFAVVGSVSSLVNQEVFRNLSIDKTKSNSAETVVNDPDSGSKLVRLTAAGAVPPLINGTQSGDLATFPALTTANPQVDVTIGSEGPFTAKLSSKPATLAAARAVLEAAIRAAAPAKPAFSGATVAILNNTLLVLAGPGDPERAGYRCRQRKRRHQRRRTQAGDGDRQRPGLQAGPDCGRRQHGATGRRCRFRWRAARRHGAHRRSDRQERPVRAGRRRSVQYPVHPPHGHRLG